MQDGGQESLCTIGADDQQIMTTRHFLYSFVLIMFCLGSCSENNSGQENKAGPEKKGHVWKEQTDTMNKAKAVEGVIQESADAQHQQVQDETQ